MLRHGLPASPSRARARTCRIALVRALIVSLATALAIAIAGCTAETAPPLDAGASTSGSPSPSQDHGQSDAAQAEAPDQKAPVPADADSAAEAPVTIEGTVLRVVDGDTAHIEMRGTREKVRFIGIDTPESTTRVEPFGKEASAYTKHALPIGRRVWLETDAELRDRYGRLLAYVWLERPTSGSAREVRAKMLNARIALDGFAQQMTIPPNVKYAEHFRACVREARDAGRGLWAAAPSQSPEAQQGRIARVTRAASARTATQRNRAGLSAGVFVTRTGRRYHRDGCPSLARSKVPIGLGEALEGGYSPCAICDPPR